MKKGQAALEFLSTYGFAFLIILVMIGALAYFGVLNPNRFLPERCNFGSEVDCRDFQLERDAPPSGDITVSLYLANQVGNTMTVEDLALSSEFCGVASNDCALGVCDVGGGSEVNIGAGEAATITCTTNGATFPASGEKIKVGVTLTYSELGGQYPHNLDGEVFATLQ